MQRSGKLSSYTGQSKKRGWKIWGVIERPQRFLESVMKKNTATYSSRKRFPESVTQKKKSKTSARIKLQLSKQREKR